LVAVVKSRKLLTTGLFTFHLTISEENGSAVVPGAEILEPTTLINRFRFPSTVDTYEIYLVLKHDLGDQGLRGTVDDVSKGAAVDAWQMADLVAHVDSCIGCPLRGPCVAFLITALRMYVLSNHPSNLVVLERNVPPLRLE